MNSMISFSPLMCSSVGFDRFNDMFESVVQGTGDRFDSYPPYNIEKTAENQYRIVVVVSGFSKRDLDIVSERDTLIVSGNAEDKSTEGVTVLYKGIATRDHSASPITSK